MTTKTVAVQLIALTSQYQKSMATATASTAKLQAASTSAGGMIGKVMGPQIALAGAVVAGAAVKMALDFDDAFTKIGAITDTSQAQVAQWKEQVMGLAGETAQAPQELAEALYFLASAGLDASQVMPALEASARASAVGLGETGDIARITANAMNAYAASGLTATQVTDTLVAAVREGTAEPDEFAGALGRILPVASKAGISFDEVAASLSSLSNIGLDVNEGVTAMRGLMLALINTTPKAEEALAKMGITSTELRDSLANNGLISTLRMLDEAAGGNIDVLGDVVGNVRALTGAFGLTQQEAEKVDAIFRDVRDSSGDLGDSFAKTAESPGHKLRQALVDLQVVLIQLGDTALPVAVTALTVFAQGVENARVKLEALGDAYMWFADILGAALVPGEQQRQNFIRTQEALRATTGPLGQYRDEIEKIGEHGFITAWQLGELLRMIDHTRGGTKQGSTEADRYRGDLDHMGGAAEGAGPPIEELGGKVKDTTSDLEDAEAAADKFSDALDRLTQVAFDVEEARLNWHQGLIELREELNDGAKVLDLNSEAGIANREAIKGQLEKGLELGIAMRENGASHREATQATKGYVDKVREAAIAAGFSKDEVDDYIRVLNLTPKDIRTLIRADTAKAEADLERYWQKLFRLNGMSVTTYVNQLVSTESRETGHSGGVVGSLPKFHSGGMASDEMLVLARAGETIRTPQQEQALRSARPGSGSSGAMKVVVVNQISPKLDRRRFTDDLDHEATYTGHWS